MWLVRSKTVKKGNLMLKLAVLVSGGGTNLQAIIDAISAGKITNACIDVYKRQTANLYEECI